MTLNPPAVEPNSDTLKQEDKLEKRGQSTVFPKPKPVVVMVLETCAMTFPSCQHIPMENMEDIRRDEERNPNDCQVTFLVLHPQRKP